MISFFVLVFRAYVNTLFGSKTIVFEGRERERVFVSRLGLQILEFDTKNKDILISVNAVCVQGPRLYAAASLIMSCDQERESKNLQHFPRHNVRTMKQHLGILLLASDLLRRTTT